MASKLADAVNAHYMGQAIAAMGNNEAVIIIGQQQELAINVAANALNGGSDNSQLITVETNDSDANQVNGGDDNVVATAPQDHILDFTSQELRQH